ncbi:Somatostatin receptor type 4 [Orchesella cincta]|uniref:Somatostatin receptor type 4 n=1 Tax=Orchesella cincta TaxID=48709 RepID=A0A1D2MUA6_ORCCI|nr:Somatostatin receptor type 4 [Orchesella cincta]
MLNHRLLNNQAHSFRLDSLKLRAAASASADCNGTFHSLIHGNEHGLPGYPEGPSNPWWAHMIVQILYGIVCLIGLCGNTLVIYVVVRFSKMQTVTNLYIVNLAIADECFLVGIPFLMTTASLGYWPFGNIVCKAYFTSTSINQITSSMFLLIMSADRYLAVCHPISAPKWRTPFIAKLVALTAWTLSALIMVPIFMYANTLEVDEAINCNIFWPDTGGWTGETVFIVYSLIISFAVPLSLIMIFYVLVIRKLRTVGPKRKPPQPSTPATTSNGNKADNNGRSPNPGGGVATTANSNHVVITPQQANRARDRKKSHRKVTKLVLTVITVYFLCWAPYWTMQLALIFTPQDQARHSGVMLFLFLFCGCLSYSNSAMNPILYAFLSENFKKSFLKACTCARGQFTYTLRSCFQTFQWFNSLCKHEYVSQVMSPHLESMEKAVEISKSVFGSLTMPLDINFLDWKNRRSWENVSPSPVLYFG